MLIFLSNFIIIRNAVYPKKIFLRGYRAFPVDPRSVHKAMWVFLYLHSFFHLKRSDYDGNENVKGTKDYLPEEQVLRNKIKELVKIRLNDTDVNR